jgi:hypothetical protein
VARRSVWLLTGVVAGAASSLYAERKLRRTVEAAAARMQPDVLVAEVGRSARQAVSSTGGRVRSAVASGRQEKRRREVELWSELDRTVDGMLRHPVSGAVDGAGADDALLPSAAMPTSTRRVRRSSRRSRSHLGN